MGVLSEQNASMPPHRQEEIAAMVNDLTGQCKVAQQSTEGSIRAYVDLQHV